MNLANLHPLFVHLPIGIIFIGFLLEVWQLKYPNKIGKDVMLFILGNAVAFSLFSVATGWFLGDGGDYDQNMLNRHKWLGIAFTITAILLFLLKKREDPWAKKSYLPLFVISLVLLTITGHLGGNMTHGEDFLFQNHSSKTIEIENIDEAQVFAEIIFPILDKKCVSCHNPNKVKGGLRLYTKEAILAGGDSGSLFDSISEFNSSLLLHRTHLALEDEEHMPPKGKLQLTTEEKLLLDWWMENKNCFDCKVLDLEASPRVEDVLASLETDNSIRGRLARELDFVTAEELIALRQNRISVQQLSEENPLLIVNFSRRKDLTAKDFKMLETIDENIVELNLGHTNFNDTLAKHLKTFKNLTKLQLQNTQITSKGIKQLRKLTVLESLNIFGLSPSEEDFDIFNGLPNLTDIYVSPDTISEENIIKFTGNNTVVHGQDIQEKFKASQLAPPVIIAENEIFNDSLLVTMSTVFDDAKTIYRYETKPGDTLTAEYSSPFYINTSTTIIAHSEKEGWGKSETAKAIFLKTGAKIASATFAINPHEKYKAQGPKTLIDKKRGTINFVDGQWIGYEAANLQSTLTIQEPTRLSTVSVGHLSAPTNWIFSPIGYKIWGAKDGVHYKLLKTVKMPPNPPSNSVERHLININFEEIELKSVRVQVLNQMKNPDWHQVPGGNSFIFIDEIVLN